MTDSAEAPPNKWFYLERDPPELYHAGGRPREHVQLLEETWLQAGFVTFDNNDDIPEEFEQESWSWHVETITTGEIDSYIFHWTVPDFRSNVAAHIDANVLLDERLLRHQCATRDFFDTVVPLIKTETAEASTIVHKAHEAFQEATIDIQRLCDASEIRTAIVASLHPYHSATLARARAVTGEAHAIATLADRIVDETLYEVRHGAIMYRTEMNLHKAAAVIGWLANGQFGTDNVELPEVDALIDTINAYRIGAGKLSDIGEDESAGE